MGSEGVTLSNYTWIVTKDEIEGDVSDAVGKIGPPGASSRHRFDRVISGGAEFQLLDTSGNVKFTGFILGDYQGSEPLEEYGLNFGCVSIAYRRNGRWISLEAALTSIGDTGINHFSRSA